MPSETIGGIGALGGFNEIRSIRVPGRNPAGRLLRRSLRAPFKDIAGKWCGLTTNYTFSCNTLVVTFHNGSPTKRFTVTSYEYLGDTVKMHWEDKGEKLFTDFSEFTDDGTMAQQKNASGPRRPYHRC